MSEPAEPAEDRMAALEAELVGVRAELAVASTQLEHVSPQLERIEILLRALLKQAPRRARALAADPSARAGVLTDEERARIRKRVSEGGPPKRRAKR